MYGTKILDLFRVICHWIAGIYILQNTMVGGGGWLAGEKNENEELGEKN